MWSTDTNSDGPAADQDKEGTEDSGARRHSDSSPPGGPRREVRRGRWQAGPRELSAGDLVKGIVAQVTSDAVLVDVGAKSEGEIPLSEFTGPSEIPQRDQEIEVAVVRVGDDEGGLLLSKKQADYARIWKRIVSAAETGEPIDAMVTERVKGGLRVDLGVSGFVPASHVATRDVRNLDRFVGQALRLRVLEVDQERKKVVLSHKLVVEEERRQRREQTLTRLREGLVCEGKVRSLTDYGAFIDLGGVDGLLHVSEMSWGRVNHPSEVCKVGDTLQVVVLEIDGQRNRISLGRRQILPDPWKLAAEKIRTGDTVRGRISRIVRTGAFAEVLGHDIEAFLPAGELSDRHVDDPSSVLKEGQELQLKVVRLRPEARRMTLSLVQAEQERERQEYEKYMGDDSASRVTIGDQFAEVLGALVVAEEVEAVEEEMPAVKMPGAAGEEVRDEGVGEQKPGSTEEAGTGEGEAGEAGAVEAQAEAEADDTGGEHEEEEAGEEEDGEEEDGEDWDEEEYWDEEEDEAEAGDEADEDEHGDDGDDEDDEDDEDEEED